MKILALDTATEGCSAALLIDGDVIGRELELGRGHAERILPMVDEVLAEGGLNLEALDAIAFGRGPGGFTGVRLAASVTQGLAFGAGVPVVPVSDLMAVAQRAFGMAPGGAASASGRALAAGAEGLATQPARTAADAAGVAPHSRKVAGAERLPPQSTRTVTGGPTAGSLRAIVCNDARMSEVYWACFEQVNGLATLVGSERVGRPGTIAIPAGWNSPFLACGRGFAAYPELRSRLEPHLAAVHERLLPRAHEIAMLAAPMLQNGGAVPPEQALPVYVRDEVAQPAEQQRD